MYQLHYFPGNASLAPHFLLEDMGLSFELKHVDRKQNAQTSDAYLKLNPLGRIPVLVDDDLVLFEAAAICLHLVDSHPEHNLAPALATPERAQFYKWMMFLTNTVQSDFMIYHYPDRHTTDKGGIAPVKAMAEQRLGEWLDYINQQLMGRDYLLGDMFSAADYYLLMLCRWCRGLTKPPRSYDHIDDFLNRMIKRPAVARVIESEQLPAPFC